MINGKKRFCVLSSIFITCTSCFVSSMENGEIKEGNKIREENEQGSQYHSRELKNRDLEFGGKKRNRSPQGVKVSNRNKKRGSYDRRKSKYQKVTFPEFMKALKIEVYNVYDKRVPENINEIFSYSDNKKELYFNDIMDFLLHISKRLELYKYSKSKSAIHKRYSKYCNVKRIFRDAFKFDVDGFSAVDRDSLLRNLDITFKFEHQLACCALYNMIKYKNGGIIDNESLILEQIKTIDGLNEDEEAKEFFENMKKSREEFIKNEEEYLKKISKKVYSFIDEHILSQNADN